MGHGVYQQGCSQRLDAQGGGRGPAASSWGRGIMVGVASRATRGTSGDILEITVK